MALENLKNIFDTRSAFKSQIRTQAEQWLMDEAQHSNDSRIIPFKLPNRFENTMAEGLRVSDFPLLNSTLLGQRNFILEDVLGNIPKMAHPFRTLTFDPRPQRAGTKINNINVYKGTQYIPEDSLENENISILARHSWENLYNPDHTPKLTVSNGTFQPYIYGGNVSRENLNIRNNRGSLSDFSRTAGVGFEGRGEPYIVSDLPTEGSPGGRDLNAGSHFNPSSRANVDVLRISKYLSSPAGDSAIDDKNIYTKSSYGLRPMPDNGLVTPLGQMRTVQRFNQGYNPQATLGAVGARGPGGLPLLEFKSGYGRLGDQLVQRLKNKISAAAGGGIMGKVTKKVTGKLFSALGLSGTRHTYGGIGKNKYTFLGPTVYDIPHHIEDTFQGSNTARLYNISNYGFKTMPNGGDVYTTAPIRSGFSLSSTTTGQTEIRKEVTDPDDPDFPAQWIPVGRGGGGRVNTQQLKHGYPLYFKDMRDDSYIFFRAYLEGGITEDLGAAWSPTNYIGKSESAYVYERGERIINFTLKLFANTKKELGAIYKKLNRLATMVYPMYQEDVYTGTKKSFDLRMKPPIAKLRLGELYGSENNELTGFIEALNIQVPPESPWEGHEVELGFLGKLLNKFLTSKKEKFAKLGVVTDYLASTGTHRVPKYFLVTITYRVIHEKVPSLNSQLYGWRGTY